MSTLIAMMSRHALLLMGFLLAGSTAVAEERLGVFAVTDLLLEPSLIYHERRSGEFQLGDSLLGVTWTLDEVISGHIAVGTQRLINVPARYGQREGDTVTLTEAYAQADTFLGRFRLGLQQLPFGAEGGVRESDRHFPRSLLFKEGVMGLRDIGAGYAVQNKGFFSEWVVHNGEGGADRDNQSWFTSRLGWRGQRGIRAGVSGQVGRTTPASTNDPQVDVADRPLLDVSESSRIRIGNVFFDMDRRPLAVTIEYSFGEVKQAVENFKFGTGHVDLYYRFPRDWGFLARYDWLDPHEERREDRVMEGTVGIAYRSRHETSTVFLFGTKTFREGPERDTHRGLLVWRLTPEIGL